MKDDGNYMLKDDNTHRSIGLQAAKEAEFLHYMNKLQEYIHVRKKYTQLNPIKLIETLEVFYKVLLLWQTRKTDGFLMRLKSGKVYVVAFNGHDSNGSPIKLSIEEGGSRIIKNLADDLNGVKAIVPVKELIKLFTLVLENPNIPYERKLEVLKVENNTLSELYDNYYKSYPENDICENRRSHLRIRQRLILENIKTPHKSIVQPEDLYKIHNKYVYLIISTYISENKHVEVLKFLYDELEKHNDPRIAFDILSRIISYNHLFLIERQERIIELIGEHAELLSLDKCENLYGSAKFSPASVALSDVNLSPAESNFAETGKRKISTTILFTLPYETKGKNFTTKKLNNVTMGFQRIRNLHDDQIFRFLDQVDLSFNGMPAAIFSEAIYNLSKSTAVYISLDDFYHPDFDLINGQVVFKDFSEKEALLGRKCYPHKEKAIELLRKLAKENNDFPLNVEMQDIDINLFSNYAVEYRDETGKGLWHRVYTVTNLDTYLKVKKRYIDKINELNLTDEYLAIKTLMFDTIINSGNVLSKFVLKLIHLVLTNSIELRGCYKYLWNNGKPVDEPEAQPFIRSQLQPHCELKGIQLTREIDVANGKLDFFCSYTIGDGTLSKVCVEVKNAHNRKLLDGLTKQLPAYMKGENTKFGIFIVLWYKCKEFQYPATYKDINALRTELEKNIPDKLNIKIVVIDCTKKISPSKL